MKIKYAWLPLFSLIVTLAQAQQPAAPAAQVDQTPKPNPAAPMYRATGEQYRIYEFPGTGESIPYRLYVPEDWQPGEKLPMLITLRAGNSINNNASGVIRIGVALALGVLLFSGSLYALTLPPAHVPGTPYPGMPKKKSPKKGGGDGHAHMPGGGMGGMDMM